MTLHTAYLAGESFTEEKRRLEVKETAKGKKTSYGLWGKYLDKTYPTLERRTINNWMGVFENRDKLQGAAVLQLTAAYKQVKAWNLLTNGNTPKKGKTEKTLELVMTNIIESVKKFNVEHPDKATELCGFLAELDDKSAKLARAKAHIAHYFETFSAKDVAALRQFIAYTARAREDADKAPPVVSVTQVNAAKKSKAQKAADKAAIKTSLGQLSADLSKVVAPAFDADAAAVKEVEKELNEAFA